MCTLGLRPFIPPFVGLAKTIYIRLYGIIGRKSPNIRPYTVYIYTVLANPTLLLSFLAPQIEWASICSQIWSDLLLPRIFLPSPPYSFLLFLFKAYQATMLLIPSLSFFSKLVKRLCSLFLLSLSFQSLSSDYAPCRSLIEGNLLLRETMQASLRRKGFRKSYKSTEATCEFTALALCWGILIHCSVQKIPSMLIPCRLLRTLGLQKTLVVRNVSCGLLRHAIR